jgi:hypothetical protein
VSADVTIPADVAAGIAKMLRDLDSRLISMPEWREWADVLDGAETVPASLSLHEQITARIGKNRGHGDDCVVCRIDAKDVLGVVRDAITSLPYTTVPHWVDPASGASEKAWRESTVLALFDGGAA